MQEIIEVISTVGFPIAVCIYLLYERDKRTKQMTEALVDLKIVIQGLR